MYLSKASNLLHRRVWVGMAWLWVLLVCYFSITPKPPVPDLGVFSWDKLNHALAYAWLMAWFIQCYSATRSRLLIGIFLILMGALLEGIQSLTPQRMYELNDMIANTIGVTAVFALAKTPLQNILFYFERTVLRSKHG